MSKIGQSGIQSDGELGYDALDPECGETVDDKRGGGRAEIRGGREGGESRGGVGGGGAERGGRVWGEDGVGSNARVLVFFWMWWGEEGRECLHDSGDGSAHKGTLWVMRDTVWRGRGYRERGGE